MPIIQLVFNGLQESDNQVVIAKPSGSDYVASGLTVHSINGTTWQCNYTGPSGSSYSFALSAVPSAVPIGAWTPTDNNGSLVSSLVSERFLVQSTLIDLAKNGVFMSVKYDSASGHPFSSGDNVTPKTILTNEISAAFAVDKKQGRRFAEAKTAWQFQLILAFDQEVLLDEFTSAVTDPVPYVPSTDTTPQINLLLEKISVSHPFQQQAALGTHVTLVFNAVRGRV